MSNDFGLSATQRKTLQEIVSELGDQIERVAVFGSRATGRHRPNSVLRHSPLKAQIDAVAVPLFERTEQGLATVDD